MNTYLNERAWRFVGFIATFAVMTLLMLPINSLRLRMTAIRHFVA